MLVRLVIHDVVLIEKMTLSLAAGLNVFTGETGAGKSIVLDALGLALGERTDAAVIRQGASQASVAAEFMLAQDHAVFFLAQAQGLVADNPVVLRRVIGRDGKTRAFFNDQPIGIGLLKRFGETLLEIHGQFETHGLLNPATHEGLLDAFGGLSSIHEQTAQAFNTWRDAEKRLRSAQEASLRARDEAEYLRAAVCELEDLAPQMGEADALASERSLLQNREKILDALNAASTLLDGERGAIASLSHAGKSVARVADKADGLDDLLASIDGALNETSEASHQLARVLTSLDARPDALQKIEERLFALRAAARKYNVQVDQIPDVLKDLSARLGLLSDENNQMADLAGLVDQTRQKYVTMAQRLSDNRKKAASKLETKINQELPSLKLEKASFSIELSLLSETHWTEGGWDRVTFLATTNIGSSPGPLHKIASGGELARFMLALKTALAQADPVPVLVFDEVDAGIGGAVASSVGQRLASLSLNVQILVVTHSPQVAARGAHHWKVTKRVQGGKTVTDVVSLDKDARREEIARMLSGAEITDAARQAADSLLFELPPKVEKRRKKA